MAAATAEGLVRRRSGMITLLPAEKLLRELLLNCRENLQNSQVPSANQLEIWITGGWVRDRLLGIPCSDVDIALSTMTGAKFGKHVTEFFQQNKQHYTKRADELGAQDSAVGGLQTTKKNPKKSKSLETTMGRIFGLDVDLLNLRREVYEENSRTPEMEFGTAAEDAFRRDATVNSLFFNLDTLEVVDFTGKGLDDMAARIMRTPLQPRQTFMDDPLRVMRLIRISSKLGYSIEKNTMQWMADEGVHRALCEKVSRERIGIEMVKIFGQRHPEVALRLLLETNLYCTVFLSQEPLICQALRDRLPPLESNHPWPGTWQRAYGFLASLLDETKESSLGRMVQLEETMEDIWLMAAYAPVAGLRHDLLATTVEVAKTSINANRRIYKLLGASIRNMDSIQTTVGFLTSHGDSWLSRSSVGMAIRTWGTTWKSQLVFCLLSELVYEKSPKFPMSLRAEDGDPVLQRTLEPYSAFVDYVLKHHLQHACSVRPLLDWNEIMEVLGVEQGGQYLKVVLDELVAWQFDNESASREEAREWLLRQRDRLRSLVHV